LRSAAITRLWKAVRSVWSKPPGGQPSVFAQLGHSVPGHGSFIRSYPAISGASRKRAATRRQDSAKWSWSPFPSGAAAFAQRLS
jgi:hypothetical protein